MTARSIALLGEYMPQFPPHVATGEAVAHAVRALGVDVHAEWVATDEIAPDLFKRHAGIWVAPGGPYKSLENMLWAIRYAREGNVPCIGTCGGFQHVMIEYARNVLRLKDAHHALYDADRPNPFIAKLACSLAGREMKLAFVPGSRVAGIYGGLDAAEQYYCSFGINPDYVDVVKRGPLIVSGSDAEGEIRVVEHPRHPFFISTLFVPQMRSTAEHSHPLVTAFVAAVAGATPTKEDS